MVRDHRRGRQLAARRHLVRGLAAGPGPGLARILDPSLTFHWDERPYWQQYEWDFPQHVFKWYAEETIFAGPFALSGGVKQFLVGVSREDLFDVDPDLEVDSDSNLLFSGGVTYETPLEGLDLFAGYSENFKALSALLLEVPGRSLDPLEPETASNIRIGCGSSRSIGPAPSAWG